MSSKSKKVVHTESYAEYERQAPGKRKVRCNHELLFSLLLKSSFWNRYSTHN